MGSFCFSIKSERGNSRLIEPPSPHTPRHYGVDIIATAIMAAAVLLFNRMTLHFSRSRSFSSLQSMCGAQFVAAEEVVQNILLKATWPPQTHLAKPLKNPLKMAAEL